MVARIIEGEEIRGAVEYNEEKVAKGAAELLYAHLYAKDASNLSFKEKLFRLQHLADLAQRADNVCTHISIGFHPSEKLPPELLRRLAVEYMEKIDFGNQPFLLYEHFDTAIQHMHIVTTKIKDDGKAIDTSFIGIKKSIPATEYLEEKYGLIKAKEQKSNETIAIKAADLKAIQYGEKPTKKEISRVVRSVISLYEFGSLTEFNSILRQFNVVADQGEENSRMRKHNGLVYRAIQTNGELIGKGIKSSSIYGKPKLDFLQGQFKKKKARPEHRERIYRIIDDVLNKGVDEKRFLKELSDNGIYVHIHRNKEGIAYGITFVDNLTLTVFKGSDIERSFSVKGIFSRLQPDEDIPAVSWNKQFVNSIISQTDYKPGIKGVLCKWLSAGMHISAGNNESGPVFLAGHSKILPEYYWKLDRRVTNYLIANGLTSARANYIDRNLAKILPDRFSIEAMHAFSSYLNVQLNNLIDSAFEVIHDDGISSELLKEAKKKKRYRRR